MKRYRAIITFSDLQDNQHIYKVGSDYPRDGSQVTQERINELLGGNNKINRPVIEEYEEEVPFEAYTAKQLNSMTIAQIEQLAEDMGIEITSTLKADIIEEFLSKQ